MAFCTIKSVLLLVTITVAEECIISPEEVQAWNSDLIVAHDQLTNGEYSVRFTFPGVTRAAFPQLWTCLLKESTITLSVLDSQNNVIEETYQRFKKLQTITTDFNVDNTRACKKFTFELKLNGHAPNVAKNNFQPIRKEIVARPVSTPQLDFISGHTSIILNIRGNECVQHLKNIALYCKPGNSQSEFPLSLAGIEDTNTPQVSKRATFENLVPNKKYTCTSMTLQYFVDGTQFHDEIQINEKISTSAVQLEVEPIKSEYQGKIQVFLKTPNLSVKKFIKWKHEHETAFQQMEMTKNNYLVENLHYDELYNVCMEFSPLNRDLSCRSMCDSRQCQQIKTLPGKPSRVAGLRTVQRHAHSVKLRWTALSRHQARGDFQYYVISAEGVLKRQVAGCTSSPTHKTQATVLSSQSETELLILKPYHKYELVIWAKNDQYDGVKSNPVSVSTKEFINSPLTRRDVAWTVTSAELVTVTVKSKCIFAEKVYLTAYLKEGSNLRENALYDRSKDRTDVKITSGFSPGRNYEACVKLCLPQGKCGGGTCDSINIPEEPPSTPPRITVKQRTIKHNEFTAELQDPTEDNGQIIKYNVVVQKHCAVQDKKCPPCTNFYTDGDLIVPRTGTITTHTFQSLKPGREYKITVNAENTAGKSPNAATLVNVTISLPSNYVPDFSYSTGTNEITVNAKPICPYQGPVKYYVMYTQKAPSPPSWSWKGSGSGTIVYDIDQDRSLSYTFNRLETGYKYEVCMEAQLQACYSPQNCKSKKPNCNYITTKCNKVPPPSKDPVFVPWIDQSQWNPFTESRLLLQSHTFNNNGGSIYNYTVVWDGKMATGSFDPSYIDWDKDSHLTLTGLKPEALYRVKIIAHGCKNEAETEYLEVKTRSIQHPKVFVQSNNDLYSKYCAQVPFSEGMTCKVIVIVDSYINVKYGAFTNYTIENHQLTNVFEDGSPQCTIEEKVPGEEVIRRVCVLEFPEDLAAYNITSVSQYGPIFHLLVKLETGTARSAYAAAGVGISCIVLGIFVFVAALYRKALLKKSGHPSSPHQESISLNREESSLTLHGLNHIWRDTNTIRILKAEFLEVLSEALVNREDPNRTNGQDIRHPAFQPTWVHGFQNRPYIVAETPEHEESEAFWSNVLDSNVSLILMVGDEPEDHKGGGYYHSTYELQETLLKQSYWPSQQERATFGNLIIECQNEYGHPSLAGAIIREFKVYRDNESLDVQQLHYQRWPQTWNNASPEVLLDLIQVMKVLQELRSGCILMHSPIDTSSLGLVIALDSLIREIEAQDPDKECRVGIKRCVTNLKQEEMLLIENFVQYKFLHRCVTKYLLHKEHLRAGGLYELDYPDSNHRHMDTAV